MINKLSEALVNKLLDADSSDDERELYVYGCFIMISHLLFLIITCAAGALLGCFVKSLIFYVEFQFIRRYAGGYHASTETRCEIMSALSLLICVAFIKMTEELNIALALLTLPAAVCIFFLCPLDTPEKPLSKDEMIYFRKISRLILSVIFVIILISFVFNLTVSLVPSCISLILESILLISGKAKDAYIKKCAE